MSTADQPPPRTRVLAECQRRGSREFALGCRDLLLERHVDDQLVLVLGGVHAEAVLAGRDKPYWLRVWAARGLFWAYDDVAEDALISALNDEHWRVREMACKVVARHGVSAAFNAVSLRREDEVSRVSAAADRALSRLVRADR